MRYQDVALLLAGAAAPRASAQAGGSGWPAAYERADAALAQLSAQDKINMVTGVGWGNGPCVGNTPAVGAIGYPELCLQDAPTGIRYASRVTAFTPGIQAGATWDRGLMRERGQFMGEETKASGIHVLLGPVAGPLGKIPAGGRNWEGFAADPYLAGVATAETVAGMQGAGIQANVKHYIANEQELNRETMSSDVDDRTMHELYLWPFADAVRADVASVMCAYNKLNGTWACEDDKSLNGLLKTELGFPGYVLTDWNAQHSTALSANAGLDMTMPGSDYNGGNQLWGPRLQQAVNSGEVPQARVDDMARRILAAWYLTGQDAGYPAVNLNADVQGDHKTNVRAVARDGIVLLKNADAALPLARPASLALVGSAAVKNPDGINSCVDHGCNKGALGMGWGSGTVNYPYFVAPADAIQERAQADGTRVTLSASDDAAAGANAAGGADAALVFITADSGEGYITVEGHAGDRNNLDPWHSGNQLVQAVAQQNENVIVVVHSVGPVLLETILALPSVKAVVWAGLPSGESGNALVDVLYGATAPSGKLPYTIGKTAADYGTSVVRGDDKFTEGLYIDYRHFDQAGIAPRYEFGFGLSYTDFTYSDLAITGTPKAGPATGDIVPGGRADLWEEVASVTCRIANSGDVEGAEVAQLYVGFPASVTAPPRQLRGFDKLPLAAGADGTATFALRRRDLSYWDVASQEWVVPSGTFNITVGASSRDLRLVGKLTVA